MVGYLVCGFVLNLTGVYDYERLTMIGNLGVTLLLFTVGLKLEVRSLFRPIIWAGSVAHAALVIIGLGILLHAMSLAGVQAFSDLDLSKAALIGFALSLSSTVFAVKTLEDKGEYRSSYGQIAVGVMIMQDIFSVVFLAASTGKLPSVWALGLLALIPGRHLLMRLLSKAGHNGELQILYGIALAFGSYALFKSVDVKGDLGALIVGTLLATHPLAGEVSKRLMGFKDLLLVGFFLSIGMSGNLTVSSLLVAFFLCALLLFKLALFFAVFTRFQMRARNGLLASLTLTNYSEFGLLVGAVAVSRGWLSEDWLVTIAVAVTISIIVAAPLNARADSLYQQWQSRLRKWETEKLLPEDEPPDFGDARIVVIGMGELGTAVYDNLVEHGQHPIGMDILPERIAQHRAAGRKVVWADATNHELWETTTTTTLKTGIVAFRLQQENLCIVTRVRQHNPKIDIFAVAGHEDEVQALKTAGAKAAWNIYREAGVGLGGEVLSHYQAKDPSGGNLGQHLR
jgi:predicted Kef-type K+ transport protein